MAGNEGSATDSILKAVEYGREIEREIKQPHPAFWLFLGIVVGYYLCRFMDWFYWEVLI
jgi:hypothetical protein